MVHRVAHLMPKRQFTDTLKSVQMKVQAKVDLPRKQGTLARIASKMTPISRKKMWMCQTTRQNRIWA
jgi:hypothetical protein